MALQQKDFTGNYTSGTGVKYTYTLRVVENSVDDTKNISNITVRAILKDSYGITFSDWGTGVSCTLNGKAIFNDYRQRNYKGPGENVFYSWTGDIAHASDGTLKLKVGGQLWQNDPANWSPKKIEIKESDSNSMVLTPIARESTAGAADAYIGSNTIISVNRNNSSYTHEIRVQFGSIIGYIGGNWTIVAEPEKLTDTSIAFKIPYEFYEEISDKPSGECTLTVTTYDGDTQIGDFKESKFKCLADPAQCAPVLDCSVVDVNGNTIDATKNGKVLVRSMSTARCAIVATGYKGASIVEKKVNGAVVTGDYIDISDVDTNTFTFSATDSRGFSATATVTAELIPYVQLTNQAVCKRTDPTSGNAVLTFAGDWFNGSFGAESNFLTLKYQIGDGDRVDVQPQWHLNKYEAIVDLEGLDYSRSYTITVTVSDKLDTAEKVLVVQSGIPVFDWGENDFAFHVPVTAPQVNGICMASKYIVGRDIYLLTNLKTWEGYGDNTQSILFFGGSVYGLITADDRGGILWNGTSDVSVRDDSAGVLKITLPFNVTYNFVAISSEPITFL